MKSVHLSVLITLVLRSCFGDRIESHRLKPGSGDGVEVESGFLGASDEYRSEINDKEANSENGARFQKGVIGGEIDLESLTNIIESILKKDCKECYIDHKLLAQKIVKQYGEDKLAGKIKERKTRNLEKSETVHMRSKRFDLLLGGLGLPAAGGLGGLGLGLGGLGLGPASGFAVANGASLISHTLLQPKNALRFIKNAIKKKLKLKKVKKTFHLVKLAIKKALKLNKVKKVTSVLAGKVLLGAGGLGAKALKLNKVKKIASGLGGKALLGAGGLGGKPLKLYKVKKIASGLGGKALLGAGGLGPAKVKKISGLGVKTLLGASGLGAAKVKKITSGLGGKALLGASGLGAPKIKKIIGAGGLGAAKVKKITSGLGVKTLLGAGGLGGAALLGATGLGAAGVGVAANGGNSNGTFIGR